MLHKNLGKRLTVALVCLLIFSVTGSAVLAAEPHEDPDTAKVVFSGIALLRYYSNSLDFVLGKNPAEVEARLAKMPFASIPQSLEESANDFATASTNISYLVVQIDDGLGKLRGLVGQFRLDEATELAGQISDNLSQAYEELYQIEQAIETTGEELKVASAPARSDLRRSYDEVVVRINRIREMLALYEELLKSTGLTPEELLKSTGLTPEELLKSTGLTLEIQPAVAFVGDDVRFDGVLTAQNLPLAGREVVLLVSGSQNITATTDAGGHYQGVLPVPYRYLPDLDVQALCYPRDKDIGLYLASLSPVVKLKVLFYEAKLEVTTAGKAYPGREITLAGRFDYGQSPPLIQRKAEIYFEDAFITEFVAQEVFTQEIKIDTGADVGKHIITVSAAADGRYAPVAASSILNVTRATPILNLTIPDIALIPGSVGVEGKLYSEIGPLSGALIKMKLDKSNVELTSSGDGSFDTKIRVGMGFGMIGWQDLTIQVVPKEPWHAPLNTTSRLLMVNVVNIGGFLAILVFLGIYLPGWLRRRLGESPGRKMRPGLVVTPPEPVSASSDSVLVSASVAERESDNGEPRHRIFYWYRLVVRFLLRIARVSLRPQQTLREFADEHSRVLGPGAKYFVELTRMVERLLYSQYRPTEQDVENSRQLSIRVEEESAGGTKG
ncbi:MAG: DUF4129 domain-containing protein [Chloroflexi bacterium]|nr:DUF4129 domain-containing protein [Chloroflexota bacterium]